jgi:tetratricopeptide (TPR) repeat protein
VLGVAAATAALGYLVKSSPGNGIDTARLGNKAPLAGFSALPQSSAKSTVVPESSPAPMVEGSLTKALKVAARQIDAGQFDDAVSTLNQVRTVATGSAEAYRQMGRALLGRGDSAMARDFLAKAISIDPTQASTYFDYARACEATGDLETALGGMRSYLHLVKDNDPFRLPVAQARSAIWEWEAQLGRGPWGPTKGVPPGFTAEQIKRDGKGTGIMMQKGPVRPDGTSDFEIKSGERFPELWKK